MAAKQKFGTTLYLVIAILIGWILAVWLFKNNFAVQLLISLLIACGIYILFIIQKKKWDKAVEEQADFYNLKTSLQQSSLDPHFLFNALNSVSFSIHKDSREDAASNLSTFSKFMRISLNNIDNFGHDLNEELEFIKNYLILEKFRFKEQFDYSIKVQPYVNDMNNLPVFSAFCFVENALKKGVMTKQGGGMIEIEVDENPAEKELIISISDNGSFRDLTKKENFTHNIMVVNALIDRLNSANQRKIKIDYSANKNKSGEAEGCRVEMRIPTDISYKLMPATI
ncbi:MAG: histidine kinase [Salinivirgaceae bacterium]|nr:histidine kinase [Salinivirgaceae bacterium]